MERLLSHLAYYHLSIVDCGGRRYRLYDLDRNECYEIMSLPYILSLVKQWDHHRQIKTMDNILRVML